ncbi:MAG: DivIVA domain-containing protein [Actinomycetota bacterium]|nr:DivIVA domain-containing protein [Actinomycetota bacterium]
MDVSPETIRTVEFRERLRGYNQDDVDQFLERMAAGVEILQQRLRDASQRAAQAEERPDGDDTLRRTLSLAQRTADLAVEEARGQAARLVESAQGEAHSVVAAAQGEAEAVMAEAEERATRLIEDAQAHVAAEVQRLQARREQLEGELVALERHVAQARARAYTALNEAARQVEHLVAAPVPLSMPVAGEAGPQRVEPGATAADTVQPPAPLGPDGPAPTGPHHHESYSHDVEPPAAPTTGTAGPVPFQGASVQS